MKCAPFPASSPVLARVETVQKDSPVKDNDKRCDVVFLKKKIMKQDMIDVIQT
jgi:hypothetical protein